VRLVFCGTPQFAIPTLQQLLAAGHDLELVVTQPDRVRGRDQNPSPPPVKVLAEQAGLPVVQPEKIKNNAELRARLEAIRPEAIIVVAYGRIIPAWMLNLPRWGNLNLHASLLPKGERHRGDDHAHRPGPGHGRYPAAALLAH
jgi:methionyl-tRNA formyltransferase